ncbi:hypothetical protein [Lysobacter capsici]|uniref:hypothetical protein n=1 Tax=Lysobacter capsici TaxID=435897 RepID=UPI001C002C31|nr:hypothetical protein [Lysobacter capsici]QWF15410.1 hypothetical protein KME82_16670 [Lysobacter capsici]
MSNIERTRGPIGSRIEWARDAALMRELASINERVVCELGALTSYGLQVKAKQKPAGARSATALDHGLKENDTMRLRDVAAIAAMATAVGSCGASEPAVQFQSVSVTPGHTQKVESLGSHYKQGMAYGPFRKLLIADGWRPAANLDECLRVTVGDDYRKICENPAISAACNTCMEFREIEACAEDGYCYMTFSGHGAQLNIKTYGDVLRLNKDGSEPIVQEWTLSAK